MNESKEVREPKDYWELKEEREKDEPLTEKLTDTLKESTDTMSDSNIKGRMNLHAGQRIGEPENLVQENLKK
ncbi:hypothetical protein ABK040_009677 [Willaertia magna]